MFNLNQKLAEICKEYKVPVKAVKSPLRNWELHQIRKRFALLCRLQNPSIPYNTIGRMLNRDHSTIINLVKNKNVK